MDSDARDVSAQQLDLTGVESGPNLKAEWAKRIGEGHSAADRPSRAIEGGEYPVACHLDERAPMLFNDCSGYDIVAFQEVAPGSIAKVSSTLR
jgi:hypothetical protein